MVKRPTAAGYVVVIVSGFLMSLGSNTFIGFHMPERTEGVTYSVSDSALCWLRCRRRKRKLGKIVRKCNAENIKDKRRI